MKNKIVLFLNYLLVLIYASCNNSGNVKQFEKKTDTVTLVADSTSVLPVKKYIPEINKAYDDVAKYIAGLNVTTTTVIDSSFLNDSKWIHYSEKLQKSWAKVDTLKIEKMKLWSKTELKEADSKIIFYPFSGADFLNAYTFFPSADTYIMAGLEPVGTLPNFGKDVTKDSLPSYFYKVNQSLFAILNFSFFRTESMSVDFKNKDLNGTIHLIALFLERTGNSIVDIKPVQINDTGLIINYNADEKVSKLNKGVEIDFINTDSVIKKVYYFSVNLDNYHLKKNEPFVKLVGQNKNATTFIKSASYLMYKAYFSEIRELIIENSDFVLQDDSGIPYKYFDQKIWTPALYGTYNGAIKLFDNVLQNDLEEAYKKETLVKPLTFGIGYKYRLGTSNLMCFKKK